MKEYRVFKHFDQGEEVEDMAFDFDGEITHPDFLKAAENMIGPIRYVQYPYSSNSNENWSMIVSDSKLNEYLIIQDNG